MKNAVLFKSLIDIFFFIHVIGFIAIVAKFSITFSVKNIDNPQIEDWIIFVFNVLIYLLFLRGLFFLRKTARLFLKQNQFMISTVECIKKSGNQFVVAGILYVLVFLLSKLLNLQLKPIYDIFSITPIFIIIVGLFFIIQSKVIHQAISFKNENDLMV